MKHNKRKFYKIIFWLVIVMIGGFVVYETTASEVEYRTTEREVLVDNLSGKIRQIKDEALDALEQCESGGYTEDDGIVIFDSNGKASYGQYQWQKASVQHYYKVLHNTDISPKEAVLIALDRALARKLTDEVVFGTEKGYTNWLNCANKIGLKNIVDLVHKLES